MLTADTAACEPIHVESVPCGLCGSTESRLLLKAPDYNDHVPGLFSLVRCTGCGLVYQNPRPRSDQINRLYPDDYGPHHDLRSPDDLPCLGRRTRKLGRAAASSYYRDLLQPPGSQQEQRLPSFQVLLANALQLVVMPPIPSHSQEPPRVLDIGCGTGRFLARMKSEGWDVQGVEIGRDAAERARALLGVPVVNRPFGPGLFRAESFDLVTMWNVLEHLASPLESLGEVVRLLKPGGWLLAQVPNLNSLEIHLGGDKAFLLDLPRHFYHFEPCTLSAMAKRAGLHVARLVYPIEPTALYISLGRRLGAFRGGHLGPGHVWRRRLLWPLCAALSSFGAGGQMVAVARRPLGLE